MPDTLPGEMPDQTSPSPTPAPSEAPQPGPDIDVPAPSTPSSDPPSMPTGPVA